MKNRIILLVFWAVFTAVFTGPPVVVAGEKTISELVANVIGPPSCTVINFGRHNYGNAKKELAEQVDGFNHFADSGDDPYEELMLEHGPYGYGCKPLVKSSLSGVIISESGRVLTLAHGIGPEADNLIFVAWAYAENGQRMLYQAKVLRVNMALDIAELEIIGTQIKFPYIAWGNSDEIITGEKALVISSPLGLPFTFNECEVAHVRRSKKMLKALFNYNAPCDMIQLSGSFLPGGSSGGPVFNKYGLLVGFVLSRIEKEPSTGDDGATGGEEKKFKTTEEKNNINISFVLPVNEVKKWLEEGK